jgi:heavy metal sensor kinase
VRRLRLRTRLTLWFAASILLILLPVLTGILVLEWRSMRAALDHHLHEDLEVASEMAVLHGAEVHWRTEADRDPGYDAGPQRWVEVYGQDGRVLFLRGVVQQGVIRAALPSPAHEVAGYRTLQTPAGAYVRTLTADRVLGTTPVRIRVARAEDDLRLELRRLVVLFGIGAPLAVLAAAVAGYGIAGRALTPLARMADRARSISADHLSERLPIENAGDELGQLATVFNETFARLENSFGRLKQFTADASHELRTPLTAIRSVGEVGLRETREPAVYQEIIGSMLEEADRLARVVDTLLTLARWESGRVRVNAELLDVGELAREVSSQLGVLAEDREVAIDVELPRPVAVSADQVMIRAALTNVLDNAIKFTRSHSRVRVSATSSEREHQLIIDDEGPGIPAEDRQRVLERFFKIDAGRNPDVGGAGLGLALVHWAMTANHGSVAIDANPAGGTRVILTLPRADAAARFVQSV